MCLIFKKFCNKENFATGDLTEEQLIKKCPNKDDGSRDWQCWYKHKGASAELYFDKVKKPCLNTDGETNEYRAAAPRHGTGIRRADATLLNAKSAADYGAE